MGRIVDIVLSVLTFLALAFVGYGVLRPGGMLDSKWQAWQKERRGAALSREGWPELTRRGGRLGTGQVRLVEFSDYQCPYCRRFHRSLTRELAGDSTVTVVYRHFPLDIHPAAAGAAIAAICAELETGGFGRIHRILFDTEAWMQDTDWVALARQAGIADLNRFELCLVSDSAKARLAADKALGTRLGVSGTPTLVTRGRIVFGALSDIELRQLLNTTK